MNLALDGYNGKLPLFSLDVEYDCNLFDAVIQEIESDLEELS